MKIKTTLNSWLAMSAFLLAMVPAATAGIIYVDADAGGANDGTSWEDGYRYLQDGLADANSAVKPVEIWVADGTYYPDANTADPCGTGDREATFQLLNGVGIYGGYAGYGAPGPDARDVELYETILSGDLDGNDVQVSDPCDLLTETTRSENSYHVVTGSDTDGTAVLDGFTITAGNATYGDSQVFDPRRCGGGMYNNSGSATVTNCTFIRNTAYYAGGGMTNYNHSNTTVINCTFIGNAACYAGSGMTNYIHSNTTVTNCTFIGNSVGGAGGGMANFTQSSPTLTKCTFIGNSASAGAGGGMINDTYCSPTVTNCTFIGNMTTAQGGGMYNYKYSSPVLTNCLFSGNITGTDGGAMYNYGKEYCSPAITNCTFTGNSANGNGGGIANLRSSKPIVTNCILWGNTAPSAPQIYNIESSSTTVSYSDVEGGWPGTGNINADPLFVSGPWGDYYLSQIAAGQISNSPCINTGSDLASALGMDIYTTRIDHITDAGQVDMGYHHPPDFPASAVDALIDIDPDTLNKKSHGRWVTVYITLPDGLDVGAINTSTIAITSLVGESCVPEYSQQADLSFVPQVGDRDEDGIADLTVKFDRQVLLPNLCLDDVAVTIEGELTTGELFSGSDSIRIIDRGK